MSITSNYRIKIDKLLFRKLAPSIRIYDTGHGEVWNSDPEKPIGSWKVAWTNAKTTAEVSARWHDLRHTFVSRVAESQVSDATIMALAGHLSVKMKERYSHTRLESKRQAILTLDMPVAIQ